MLIAADESLDTERGTKAERAWRSRVGASGILGLDWLPPAAARWLAMPPEGETLVAWFMSGDADWGDVVVWKCADPRVHPVARTAPVQAYQDWPARLGYWRSAAGDDRIARILHATYTSWNAAMRHYVKIRRLPPSSALERLRDEHADVVELTAALAASLPGSTERLPLERKTFQAKAHGIASPLEKGAALAVRPADPAILTKHERLRRLVIEYGPAVSGLCRRWGKESGA